MKSTQSGVIDGEFAVEDGQTVIRVPDGTDSDAVLIELENDENNTTVVVPGEFLDRTGDGDGLVLADRDVARWFDLSRVHVTVGDGNEDGNEGEDTEGSDELAHER